MRRLAVFLVGLAACGDEWKPEAAFPEVSARVEALRGLKLDPKPEFRVWTREEWISSVRAEAKAPAGDYDFLWKTLGIVPEGEDFLAADRRLKERFRGYYDIADDVLSYMADTPKAAREAQLAHSLIHVLQAQHSSLFELPSDEETAGYLDDVSWAWTAAREGEAVLYELAWPGDSVDGARKKIETLLGRYAIPDAPRYAVRWAYFAHVAGARYLLARSKDGLRAASDALHTSPPMSTEQVLHPERGDPPLVVVPPELKGWRRTVRTVLGEWTLADWLQTAGDDIGGGLPDDLRWGGDLTCVYRKGEDACVVAWTVWDDEPSAERFMKRVADSGIVARRGKRVVVALGPAKGAVRPLLSFGLRTLRATPFRNLDELEDVVAR
ncbi:MAG: hypothetical protein O7E54_01315 [Planctomycetota bacterium]|nr:hypothetical protein [Planctomycetota bacterium]